MIWVPAVAGMSGVGWGKALNYRQSQLAFRLLPRIGLSPSLFASACDYKGNDADESANRARAEKQRGVKAAEPAVDCCECRADPYDS